MKVRVITNPVSGRGAARRRVAELRRALEAWGHGVDLLPTSGRGDARRLAATAEGVDCIVVAGGDGTLNEVVNGLSEPFAVPLALLPTGTGNMLARELGIPRDPRRVADLIHEGGVRRVDLGRLGAHRFLSLVGCGFDAMVAQRLQRRRSGTLGYLGYLGPVLRTLVVYEPPRLRVSVDGHPLEAAFVIVGNVRNYGGIFEVTPGARCDSGVLEVCTFERAAVSDLCRYALRAGVRRLRGTRGVALRSGSRIEIQGDVPVPIQVDGDPHGTTPARIEIEPKALRFLVPAATSPRASRAPGANR